MLIFRTGSDIKKRESFDKNTKTQIPRTDFAISGEEINNIHQYFDLDIFGDKKVIRLENWNNEDDRTVLYKFLDNIKQSVNIFIIDELDMLDATANKIAKSADLFLDCREDKKEIYYTPWKLCDYFENRDKKNLWLEFTRIKEICINLNTKDKLDEPLKIVGALSYKIQNSNLSKYTKEEKSKIYFDLISIIDKDHSAEGEEKVDIWDEMEKWCLSI